MESHGYYSDMCVHLVNDIIYMVLCCCVLFSCVGVVVWWCGGVVLQLYLLDSSPSMVIKHQNERTSDRVRSTWNQGEFEDYFHSAIIEFHTVNFMRGVAVSFGSIVLVPLTLSRMKQLPVVSVVINRFSFISSLFLFSSYRFDRRLRMIPITGISDYRDISWNDLNKMRIQIYSVK